MTGEEHNKYLSWTFLANGLFQSSMLVLIYGLVIAYFALVLPNDPSFPAAFLAAVFGVAFFINFALISPNFLAYYALKNKKPWARIASIVAGVLSAMNVPIGTAACVYAMWFFFGDEWKPVYPGVAGGGQPSGHLSSAPQTNWTGQYVREDGQEVYRPANPPDWR